MKPRVLVACPTARTKDYALKRYLDAYHAFTYEPRHLVMVDTSRDSEYEAELNARGVETIRYPCNPIGTVLLVTYVWQDVLLAYAREQGYRWVLSLESDVICPPNTIDFLVDIASQYNASVVSHSYPHRKEQKGVSLSDNNLPLRIHRGIGCTLFDPSMFSSGEDLEDYFEVYIYEKARLAGLGLIVMDNLLKIEHLSDI